MLGCQSYIVKGLKMAPEDQDPKKLLKIVTCAETEKMKELLVRVQME